MRFSKAAQAIFAAASDADGAALIYAIVDGNAIYVRSERFGIESRDELTDGVGAMEALADADGVAPADYWIVGRKSDAGLVPRPTVLRRVAGEGKGGGLALTDDALSLLREAAGRIDTTGARFSVGAYWRAGLALVKPPKPNARTFALAAAAAEAFGAVGLAIGGGDMPKDCAADWLDSDNRNPFDKGVDFGDMRTASLDSLTADGLDAMIRQE